MAACCAAGASTGERAEEEIEDPNTPRTPPVV
jgi:hypothetical protein